MADSRVRESCLSSWKYTSINSEHKPSNTSKTSFLHHSLSPISLHLPTSLSSLTSPLSSSLPLSFPPSISLLCSCVLIQHVCHSTRDGETKQSSICFSVTTATLSFTGTHTRTHTRYIHVHVTYNVYALYIYIYM